MFNHRDNADDDADIMAGIWIVYAMSDRVVSGSVFDNIDESLGAMQGLMAVVNGIETAGSTKAESSQMWSLILTTGGVAGPAIVAGTLLMLNQITILLFCAFAPLFVMSLMFEQTKGMFWQWIKFGFSTMFSLGVLTIMALIVSDTVLQFAKGAGMALVAKYISGSTSSGAGSLAGMAMQQGGLGLIMTALLVTVPNMVGQFFGGTVGNFVAGNSFSGWGPGSNSQNTGGGGTSAAGGAQVSNHQTQQHVGGRQSFVKSDIAPQGQLSPASKNMTQGLNQPSDADQPLKRVDSSSAKPTGGAITEAKNQVKLERA